MLTHEFAEIYLDGGITVGIYTVLVCFLRIQPVLALPFVGHTVTIRVKGNGIVGGLWIESLGVMLGGEESLAGSCGRSAK